MLKNYHHQQQQQLPTLSIMMAKFLRLFLLLTILLSIITLVNGLQSTMSSSMDDDNDSMTDQMKQMRRNEVSKALLLLKKHSIVGSNAKIVLKNNGRHLLVDPSERIRIVSSHLSKKSTSSTTSSKSKSLKLNKKDNNSNKSEKQRMKKSNRNHRKSSSSSTTASSSSLSNSKDQLSKASRSIPSISVESVQRNIMRRASSKSPTVIDSLMGQHMLKDITEIITTIIRNKQASSLVELSDLITETLNERYGPHWHTISVASPKEFPQSESTSSNHEILLDTILSNHNQIDSLTHVAVDDHQKSAIFYVTFDFGRMLRIFIFK
ncbi:uncharacterized protein LOC113789784 [Dermatophagoides pteronyssinus]|uniref:uncharacterized protein LOC113789784 n=1 Tax=Dermatophagoides pteronyssinus TaxID=6956 RepID=UPI003F67734D